MKKVFCLLNALTFIAMTFAQVPRDTLAEEPIFSVAEEMPRFPGCEDLPEDERDQCSQLKLLQYVYKNLSFTNKTVNDPGCVTVAIRFVIEKNGQVTGVKILRDAGIGLAEELVKVLETMPRWIPGNQRGEKVRIQYQMPFRIRLE